jgi:hypothetical protein
VCVDVRVSEHEETGHDLKCDHGGHIETIARGGKPLIVEGQPSFKVEVSANDIKIDVDFASILVLIIGDGEGIIDDLIFD